MVFLVLVINLACFIEIRKFIVVSQGCILHFSSDPLRSHTEFCYLSREVHVAGDPKKDPQCTVHLILASQYCGLYRRWLLYDKMRFYHILIMIIIHPICTNHKKFGSLFSLYFTLARKSV